MESLTVGAAKRVEGEIRMPGDKSITHRAILFGGLAKGSTRIRGYLPSEDCICTLRAVEAMGVRTMLENGVLSIQGEGVHALKEPEEILQMGNSGTSLRLFTGLLSALPFFSVLDGDSSLRKRPMGRVIEPLTRMGAEIRGRKNNSHAPIAISGRSDLRSIRYRLPVPSAQVKSALLLAGIHAEGTTRIEEPLPTRDHSERMLRAFGAVMETEPGRISVSRSELKGIEIDVPGDFSSAAFFIAAALLVPGSLLRIRDVGVNPTRTGMLGVLEEMGAEITIENPRSWGGEPVADLIVESVSGLRGIDVGEARIPSLVDELPVLFVLASFAEGTSRFTGARELRVKESDRIAVMTRELRKLGVEVEELADGVVIRGGNRFRGARFSSDGDHRVAMSFAIAALAADGESRIDGTECIRTSFPGFEKLLKSVCRS